MRFDSAQFSHTGARKENEDTCALWPNENTIVAIVADGLGGHGNGRRASECVVKAAQSDGTPRERIEAGQHALLAEIDAHPECARMRSTGVLLQIKGTEAAWAHCGDSRLYYFKDGVFTKRTQDHSVPQALALAGDISDDDIRRHEDRNKLLSALGETKPKIEDSGPSIRISTGDTFLLASDGFWEHFPIVELEDTLRESPSASDWLKSLCASIEAANSENQDNYTAVAIRILEEAQ